MKNITKTHKGNIRKHFSVLLALMVMAVMMIPNFSFADTSGTSNHIEIEISGTVTAKIGDEEIEVPVTLTKEDSYTVSAYKIVNGVKTPYTDNFKYTGATEGDGSTSDDTIELSGSYPTGTKRDPVYYVVSVVKSISITLKDGTKLENIPVTLTVTTNYWDEGNNCPGIHNKQNNVAAWKSGDYIRGSGIDVPISGEYVGQAITKGKLAIKKTVTDETNSSASFQFYLQNASGEYLTFSNNAYTGTSETLTDACKVTVTAGQSLVLTDIPVGTYTITEIQKDGYIITDAEGNESDNYTKDYVVETKTDDEIPIANFTNKKLSDEAGIKIKKVGYGLSSYPNPTVAIYKASDCTNGVPNDTAEAVWSGALTTNSADFIYLNTTLPAGEYVVVETGADVEGYDLATTLTVDSSAAEGMNFTAASNSVHELIVTNVYTEQPKITDVTVTKIVTGNLGDQSKEFSFDAFYIESEGTAVNSVTVDTLKHNESTTLSDIPIGSTLYIKETNAEGYAITVEGAELVNSGEYAGYYAVTVAEGTVIKFINGKSVAIDTGVDTNGMPYMFVLAGIMLAAVVTVYAKRRRYYE